MIKDNVFDCYPQLPEAIVGYMRIKRDWLWHDDILQEIRMEFSQMPNHKNRGYFFKAGKIIAMKFIGKIRTKNTMTFSAMGGNDIEENNTVENLIPDDRETLSYISAKTRMTIENPAANEEWKLRKFSEDKLCLIIKDRIMGAKLRELQKKYRCKKSYISDLCNPKNNIQKKRFEKVQSLCRQI